MSIEFIPQNKIEKKIVDLQNEKMSSEKFMEHLLKADICLPSCTDFGEDMSGFYPFAYDSEEGETMIVVFTDESRIESLDSEEVFVKAVNAKEFFEKLGDAYGVAVNPGYEVGFELTNDDLKYVLGGFKA